MGTRSRRVAVQGTRHRRYTLGGPDCPAAAATGSVRGPGALGSASVSDGAITEQLGDSHGLVVVVGLGDEAPADSFLRRQRSVVVVQDDGKGAGHVEAKQHRVGHGRRI